MKPLDDPFVAVPASDTREPDDDFAALRQRPLAARQPESFAQLSPTIGRLVGFDLLDQALVTGVAALPGEKLPARSTVALRRSQVGREVVLCFEGGNPRAPLIMGVLEPHPLQEERLAAAPPTVQVDGERQLIEAEREVVLRCGDASITLTRAGKVIIKGHYILSRSTGANKIKGAAIDIN